VNALGAAYMTGLPMTMAFASSTLSESHLKSSLSTHTLVYAHLRHAVHGPTFISDSFTNSASSPVASIMVFISLSVLLFLTGLPLTPKTFNDKY
jgi:hypothetical protein